MKKYSAVYYLLFILLVMGAFAAMAQNSYGLQLMGGVAFIFGLVFMVEFISAIRKKNFRKDVFELTELICLFLIAFIFGLRVFYIRFPYVEWLFAGACILMVLLYLRKMILRFRQLQPKNSLLAIVILVFHFSILLFLISMATVPFASKIAEATGTVAFVLLLGFMVAGFLKKNFLVEGENVTPFKMVTHFKDHSVIIITIFILFALYSGFNRIGVLPGIYSDEFPKAYFELVDKAASRKEKPVNGRYKYDEFMEKYKLFLEHNKSGD